MENYKCTRCGIEKPLTPEYFHRNKNGKTGFNTQCKECRNSYMKKYGEENKEKIKERYQENKEQAKQYYQENRERVKEYYQENREKILEYNREYNKKNKERTKKRDKEWREKNRERWLILARAGVEKRRAKMSSLPHTLTIEDWEGTLEFFDYSCAYCGVSQEELEYSLHQEHIIPVSEGGGYTADNIIPSCKTCNLSKGAKELEEWYKSRDYYDEEKMSKVTYWITLEMKKG